ncbi:hypothetical protein ACFQVC_12820 [Streptomyces monticola]|uniref:Uncharacterized protein n=1 Tax=Streptomyces monticola TaxID=2666263 RepID=A0ABW2JGG5_9ACTN
MDTRIPCTDGDHGAETDAPAGPPTLLAELHPDALPALNDGAMLARLGTAPGVMDGGWPGFFHRAHHLLPPDGLLLLATRQRRDAGVLTDPLGTLIACARSAGFRYLQHIAIAYAHPVGDRLVPCPPGDASPGVAHCDLLVLSAINHA